MVSRIRKRTRTIARPIGYFLNRKCVTTPPRTRTPRMSTRGSREAASVIADRSIISYFPRVSAPLLANVSEEAERAQSAARNQNPQGTEPCSQQHCHRSRSNRHTWPCDVTRTSHHITTGDDETDR